MNQAKLLVVLAAVAMAFCTVAQAGPVNLSLDVTEVSHYYWRGYNVLGGAKFPIQPSITASMDNGLSANVWGSWALLDRGVVNAVDEVDFTLNYTRTVAGWVEFSAGAVYYLYPNNSSGKTTELSASAEFDDLPLEPAISVNYDTEWLDAVGFKADGWYFLGAVSHSLPIGRFSLDLGAGLGVASNSSFTGLQDLTLRAGTTIPVGKLKLTPFLSPVFTFEDNVNTDSFGLAGGMTASYKF